MPRSVSSQKLVRDVFSGRVVVVTGASRGIGAATSVLLAGRGAKVVAVARGVEGLEALAGSAEGIEPFACDVTAAADRDRLLTHLSSAHGRLDLLVNNVGGNVRKPTLEYTDLEFAEVMKTNLEPAWALSRSLHPLLAASGAGSIVNVSSVAAKESIRTSSAAYAVSKAGLEALTRFLAVEWAPDGIRVNAVAPWYVRTPLAAAVLEDKEKLGRILARTPAGRVGEPAEVAAAIAFLGSKDASWITGVVLPVDGGFSALGL